MAAMTSFHAENFRHLVNAYAASTSTFLQLHIQQRTPAAR